MQPLFIKGEFPLSDRWSLVVRKVFLFVSCT